MSPSLRVAGLVAALLAAGASPAAAQTAAPPTLADTELSATPETARVGVLTCTAAFGYSLVSSTGSVHSEAYDGSYREEAAARLGGGGLSEDFEPRPLRAAVHSFFLQSRPGAVFGTLRALPVADAATCVSPYFQTARLYLSYAAETRYAARIETAGGVYVDRGDGFVTVDVVEGLDGSRSANTQTTFDFSDQEAVQPLRRRDCRGDGFADLAYRTLSACREAASTNPAT